MIVAIFNYLIGILLHNALALVFLLVNIILLLICSVVKKWSWGPMADFDDGLFANHHNMVVANRVSYDGS